MNLSIAFFITPHGYGHAARASGLMSALWEIDHGIGFEIFTTVPEWFFHESIPAGFAYHPMVTDIGLVQNTPFRADLTKTADMLDRLLPFDESLIMGLAEKVMDRGCCLTVCDISPMGILVAEKAGIPSVLVENFTWDWLYEEYVPMDIRLNGHIRYLRQLYQRANHHIQTMPVCEPLDADLVTLPVSRKPKTDPDIIRKRLGIPENAKVVMITSGGIQEDYHFLKGISDMKEIRFIICSRVEKVKKQANLYIIPHHAEYFHPDLLNASNAVIGKAGYSTLAEAYHIGIPFGYVTRADFRESEVLASFIEREMKGIAISVEDFYEGGWTSRLSDLLALPEIRRSGPFGADQAAGFIHSLISRVQ